MKLKCNDGKVRRFSICTQNSVTFPFWNKARCLECGETFGVHDTYILKPIFKAHICKMEKEAKNE